MHECINLSLHNRLATLFIIVVLNTTLSGVLGDSAGAKSRLAHITPAECSQELRSWSAGAYNRYLLNAQAIWKLAGQVTFSAGGLQCEKWLYQLPLHCIFIFSFINGYFYWTWKFRESVYLNTKENIFSFAYGGSHFVLYVQVLIFLLFLW